MSAIKKATEDGFGPHAAIVTSASPSGYEQALDYIRPGGTVVAVGLPAGAVVKSEVFWHVVCERKLVGSYVGNRQDAHEGMNQPCYKRPDTDRIHLLSSRSCQHEERQGQVPLCYSALGRPSGHL